MQGEAMTRQEVAVGTSRGIGGAMRGDATTSRGKRGGTTTRRRVRGSSASRGCSTMRSHATTKGANRRRWHAKRW